MAIIHNTLTFGLILLSVGTLFAGPLDDLDVAYRVKLVELENSHSESIDKLEKGYLGALDRVQKTLQKSGRLDDVLKVTKEREYIESKSWPLPNLEERSPANLVEVRKLYEKTRIQADRKNAAAIDKAAQKMDGLLKNLVSSLTREGKITEAKRARARREEIASDLSVVAARNYLKRVKLDQSSPVAFRARRSGDDLEVLVRYDKSGKVSLNSPVENVIEITGGKGEKGDTKAKNLGEFVGAKGYNADSFVAFKSDFETSLPASMGVHSLVVTPGVNHKGRKGLRIKMGPKAINPRIEWLGLLDPITSATQVKLDFSYFIPKENKILNGFAIHQGLVAPFDGKVMTTQGRWIDESIVADPINSNTNLRIYFEGLAGGGKTFNGGNEIVYLDNLTVTFQKFAAHTVATYDDGKVTGEPVADATLQKAFILLGKFVTSK